MNILTDRRVPFSQQPQFSIFEAFFAIRIGLGSFSLLVQAVKCNFLRFLEITGDQLLHGEGCALLDGGYRRQGVDGCALWGQAGRPQLAGWGPSVVERGAVVVELVEVLGAVA